MGDLRLLICLGALWLAHFSTAQIVEETEAVSHEVFGRERGLKIGNIQSMVFDDQGWLWLSGIESRFTGNVFVDQKLLLQRFDGEMFIDVPLPSAFHDRFYSIEMVRRHEKRLYISAKNGKEKIWYTFDPSALTFKAFHPPGLPPSSLVLDVSFRQDTAYVFSYNGQQFEVGRVENVYKPLFTIPGPPLFLQGDDRILLFDDHVLISANKLGLSAYSYEGVRLRSFEEKDLDARLSAKPAKGGVLKFVKHRQQLLTLYPGASLYSRYNDSLKTWMPTQLAYEAQREANIAHTKITTNLVTDPSDNLLAVDIRNGEFYLKRALKKTEPAVEAFKVSIDGATALTSRDLSRELWLAEPGKLNCIRFAGSSGFTYLEQSSVRGILPREDGTYLVTTESHGWFTVDTRRKTVSRFDLSLNGKAYLPKVNRNILEEDGHIWAATDAQLLYLEKGTREPEIIPVDVYAMTISGDYVYYGAKRGRIARLHKHSRKEALLFENDSLQTVDMEPFNGSVYATTNRGLLKFNEKGEVSRISMPVDNSTLMMLEQNKPGELLITTTKGKVYTLNDQENLSLLYEDSLQSPVAFVETDAAGRRWLGTFNGLVRYDPQNRETVRFSESDGLTSNEFNRYSARLTAEGTLLLGTVKGLNHIDPLKLKKKQHDIQLSIARLQYYSDSTNKSVTEISPERLAHLGVLTLPAENRYIKVETALLGVKANHAITLRYRLNNNDWKSVSRSGTVELPSLDAGAYTLRIEAVDHAGARIGAPIVLQLHAEEFFYRKPGFWAILFLIVIAMGYYLLRQAYAANRRERKYARTLLKVQEEERLRLSHELHDGVGQQLILLKNQATYSKHETLAHLASDTLEEVRSITRDLHPVILDRLGLTAAIEEMVRKLDEHTDVFLSTELHNIDDLFSKEEALHLYRILQEAFNNLVKHAEATSAQLTIQRGSGVKVTLKDNGKGFDLPSKQAQASSLGLKTLEKRARMLGGKLKITSGKTGTRLILEIAR